MNEDKTYTDLFMTGMSPWKVGWVEVQMLCINHLFHMVNEVQRLKLQYLHYANIYIFIYLVRVVLDLGNKQWLESWGIGFHEWFPTCNNSKMSVFLSHGLLPHVLIFLLGQMQAYNLYIYHVIDDLFARCMNYPFGCVKPRFG